jgi:hypothetical protein
MSCQQPNSRPYCPGVRVGNWFEDIALEEDILKDYLDKRERGELLFQKTTTIGDALEQKVELTVSRDGNVHFGDVIMIVNPQSRDCQRCSHAFCYTVDQHAVYHVKDSICAETLQVSASPRQLKPAVRSAFIIRSCDGSPNGELLRYNQPFYISTADGEKYLTSDRATVMCDAKMSRHGKVWFAPQISRLTEWKVLPYDPLFRLELEYTPVPANSKVIINHVATNENLCMENFLLNTHFGKEFEVACYSDYDIHRAEKDSNHWMLTMPVPGDSVLDVLPPDNDDTSCQPICRPPCISASGPHQASGPHHGQ